MSTCNKHPVSTTDLGDALAVVAEAAIAANHSLELTSLAEQDAEAALRTRQHELVASGAVQGKNEAERAAQLHQQTEPERQLLRNRATAAAHARFAHERALAQLAAMRDQLRVAELVQRGNTAIAAGELVRSGYTSLQESVAIWGSGR